MEHRSAQDENERLREKILATSCLVLTSTLGRKVWPSRTLFLYTFSSS